ARALLKTSASRWVDRQPWHRDAEPQGGLASPSFHVFICRHQVLGIHYRVSVGITVLIPLTNPAISCRSLCRDCSLRRRYLTPAGLATRSSGHEHARCGASGARDQFVSVESMSTTRSGCRNRRL